MEGSYPIFEKLREGGDYQQWAFNINYELLYHTGLDIFTSDRAHLHKLSPPPEANRKKAGRLSRKKACRSEQKNFIFYAYKAAEVICSYVPPTMLSRIPEATGKEPWELWQLLKTLSEPFPLFKLPMDIRFMVYNEASNDQSQWETSTGGERIPALLKSCPTIRNEASQFLYPQRKFVRNLDWDVGRNYSRCTVFFLSDPQRRKWNEESAEAPLHVLLGDWKRKMMPDKLGMRYLRNLTVDFQIMPMPSDRARQYPTVEINFEVDVKRPASQMLKVKVEVRGPPREAPLVEEIRTKLEEHVKNCNALAETRDWQGEVIFHAMKSNPRLWMLEWEDLEIPEPWTYLRR